MTTPTRRAPPDDWQASFTWPVRDWADTDRDARGRIPRTVGELALMGLLGAVVVVVVGIAIFTFLSENT